MAVCRRPEPRDRDQRHGKKCRRQIRGFVRRPEPGGRDLLIELVHEWPYVLLRDRSAMAARRSNQQGTDGYVRPELQTATRLSLVRMPGRNKKPRVTAAPRTPAATRVWRAPSACATGAVERVAEGQQGGRDAPVDAGYPAQHRIGDAALLEGGPHDGARGLRPVDDSGGAARPQTSSPARSRPRPGWRASTSRRSTVIGRRRVTPTAGRDGPDQGADATGGQHRAVGRRSLVEGVAHDVGQAAPGWAR